MNPGVILFLVALFGFVLSLVLAKTMMNVNDDSSTAFFIGCNVTCIGFVVLGAVMWAAS